MERKEVICVGVAILAIVFLLVSAQIPKTTSTTAKDTTNSSITAAREEIGQLQEENNHLKKRLKKSEKRVRELTFMTYIMDSDEVPLGEIGLDYKADVVVNLEVKEEPEKPVPTPDDLYDNIAKGEHLVFNQGPYITVLALEDCKVQRIVLFEIDGHFYRPMNDKTFDEDEARIKAASLDDVFIGQEAGGFLIECLENGLSLRELVSDPEPPTPEPAPRPERPTPEPTPNPKLAEPVPDPERPTPEPTPNPKLADPVSGPELPTPEPPVP